MKDPRVLILLTVVNLLLLVFTASQTRAGVSPAVAPILRGGGLEIVDERGRVRASITILPADSMVKMPDGTKGYPETVLLRLISSKGRPNVKIAATERGAGALFGGEADPTYVQIISEGVSPSMKLSGKDGRERLIAP